MTSFVLSALSQRNAAALVHNLGQFEYLEHVYITSEGTSFDLPPWEGDSFLTSPADFNRFTAPRPEDGRKARIASRTRLMEHRKVGSLGMFSVHFH